ncbi:MAG: hypothetical protein HY904_07920 [Deltaproteobacteria bacterium]|nr:hypothetical protein [Deltaproteobacteria bacterium]
MRCVAPVIVMLAVAGCVEDVAVGSSYAGLGATAGDAGVCSVLAQNCGQPFLRCEPLGPASTRGTCVPRGRAGHPGAECADLPPDAGDVPRCGRGLVCLRRVPENPGGRCFALCGPEHGCPGGSVCAPPPGGNAGAWGVCIDPAHDPAPPCDGLAQDCGTSGQACVVRPGAPNQCVPAGNGAAGTVCASAADCAKGYQCTARVPQGGGPPAFVEITEDGVQDGRCMTLCGVADPVQCSATERCITFRDPDGTDRTDIGVCLPTFP